MFAILQATYDTFRNDGEWSALQALRVILFTDSQPVGLGYSNEWTFGPEDSRAVGLGYSNGWTFGPEDGDFRADFLRPEGPAIQIA